jgi:hypothetical protein
MNRRPYKFAALLALATAVLYPGWLSQAIRADPAVEKSRDAEEKRETARLIEAELPYWKLWEGPGRQTELKLEPKPILRWTNPGTGRIYGDIFVWTSRGRPEVVLSLFKGWEPVWGLTAEVHSVALTNIVAERDKKVVWQPGEPGITLRDAPDTPEPADTPTRRLRQMRDLAQTFSSFMIDYRRNQNGERQTLRLLTQPIYRYESPEQALIDGAIFAFVLGTDPEVLLLCEARQIEGRARWQYALARLNNDELFALQGDREVWRIERARYLGREREAYMWLGIPESPKPE